MCLHPPGLTFSSVLCWHFVGPGRGEGTHSHIRFVEAGRKGQAVSIPALSGVLHVLWEGMREGQRLPNQGDLGWTLGAASGLHLQVWCVKRGLSQRTGFLGRGQPTGAGAGLFFLSICTQESLAVALGQTQGLPPTLPSEMEDEHGVGLGRKNCCPLIPICKVTSEVRATEVHSWHDLWPLAQASGASMSLRPLGLPRLCTPLLFLLGRHYP